MITCKSFTFLNRANLNWNCIIVKMRRGKTTFTFILKKPTLLRQRVWNSTWHIYALLAPLTHIITGRFNQFQFLGKTCILLIIIIIISVVVDDANNDDHDHDAKWLILGTLQWAAAGPEIFCIFHREIPSSCIFPGPPCQSNGKRTRMWTPCLLAGPGGHIKMSTIIRWQLLSRTHHMSPARG